MTKRLLFVCACFVFLLISTLVVIYSLTDRSRPWLLKSLHNIMPSRIAETYVGVTKGSIEQPCFDVEEVLQEATMVEKVALLAGETFRF